MLKIISKTKHGGIWNGTRIVKEFETDDAVLAEKLKSQGFTVEEINGDINTLTVVQLKELAKENGIELGDAKTKDAILDVINAALADKGNE